MNNWITEQLETNGFSLVEPLHSPTEICEIKDLIEKDSSKGSSFLKSSQLFAIRQLFDHIPELIPIVFNQRLCKLAGSIIEQRWFVSKSIYFDKPVGSNWFVAYHQDLSIGVTDKIEASGYQNWTFKRGQWGVQPPAEVLERTLTLRIHLDDTNESNGALRVIPGSHKHGIVRKDEVLFDSANETLCAVKEGEVMLMRPLLFHASKRTQSTERRRVIHLELSHISLTPPLKWLERHAPIGS